MRQLITPIILAIILVGCAQQPTHEVAIQRAPSQAVLAANEIEKAYLMSIEVGQAAKRLHAAGKLSSELDRAVYQSRSSAHLKLNNARWMHNLGQEYVARGEALSAQKIFNGLLKELREIE